MNFGATTLQNLMLGPFLFGAPLALAALILLPVIWWVLRATPPAPRAAELPSLRLLDDIDPREETPDRTPWWLLLLRLLAAALAIGALAQPVFAPAGPADTSQDGPLLVVVDDGWSSALRWRDVINAADAGVAASGRDTPTHLLRTAPQARHSDPAERFSRQEMRRRLDTVEPVSWGVDRNDALRRLDDSGLAPARILWATSGLSDGTDLDFAAALAARAALSVYVAQPRGPAAITGLSSDASGVALTVRRVGDGPGLDLNVSALTIDGASLATAPVRFEPGSDEAVARFELPGGALSRISRFTVTGQQGASLTWLWDSANRMRRVGLVSGGGSAQPLLSDVHYVRKALEPFATIIEGELADIVQARPDAIILTDIGTISPSAIGPLTDWIESGGALIRFSGPNLAAQSDSLVPVPLRRTARALGGALAWDEPQAIDDFPDNSPFAGLAPPSNAVVRQQVLAQPAADLQARTWARLEDGSPVVTAASRGSGTVILFHVTAGPGWSDLPYTGTFTQMLRRAIAAGRSEVRIDEEGAYSPRLTLDGAGRLVTPPGQAAPVMAAQFETVQPSPQHPPGLYRGPAGTRAINSAAGARPRVMDNWPAGVQLLGDAQTRRTDLAGPLLTGALLLVMIDLLIALSMAGRLPRLGKAHTAFLLIVGLSAIAALPETAYAQAFGQRSMEDGLTKSEAAAINMRFAYIETGDSELDEMTRAGLTGLSRILFLRTSVEPAQPDAVNPQSDALELYPLIYYAVPEAAEPLPPETATALNRYMRNGGALIIDTRSGGDYGSDAALDNLSEHLAGLDLPALVPADNDHVITKSFYLIDGFPGRYSGQPLWLETTGPDGETSGDGVSRLFVGTADWASAWAIDNRARPLASVDGGSRQREMANRFGVNLVMYILTGNYKSDQVHLPALLERLGEDGAAQDGDFELDDLPPSIRDGGPR